MVEKFRSTLCFENQVKMLVNDMALPLSTHRSCKTHLHDIVERTTEDNFPNAVRLLTTLSQGNNSLDIDDIRTSDFYTPLCVHQQIEIQICIIILKKNKLSWRQIIGFLFHVSIRFVLTFSFLNQLIMF